MRGFFIVSIVLYTVLLCYCKSDQQRVELSRDELLEIENQLVRLNKSSIKAIKTQHGDIYDCVDFYEQPAFDHPLLKNHKYDFGMRPSSHPYKMVRRYKPPKNVEQVSINNGLKGEKCPIGFVPIRRTTKEDLIRAKLFTKSYTSSINSPPTFHHALVYTSDPTKKYNGAGTTASYYTLYNVTGSQYTFGRMKLQNEHDIIQAGWGVNPSLYGDDQTRILIYFQAGQISCFNTLCPGFVLVYPQPMIEMTFNETLPGKLPTWEFDLNIYRDNITGNWWLQFGTDLAHVGYWPSSIFSANPDPNPYPTHTTDCNAPATLDPNGLLRIQKPPKLSHSPSPQSCRGWIVLPPLTKLCLSSSKMEATTTDLAFTVEDHQEFISSSRIHHGSGLYG
ncbi:hypothetical protein CsatA_005761 [Cannabis sativa]